MKYFTTDWWFSGCENAEAIFAEYDSYLSTIRDILPASLLEFHELHTLHDAKVRLIQSNLEANSVTIEFNGWDANLSHPVHYTLQFSGVLQFDQILAQDDGSESELGDLGYWEVELVSSGFEMRMLFASSAEFRILFSGFSYTHESPRT